MYRNHDREGEGEGNEEACCERDCNTGNCKWMAHRNITPRGTSRFIIVKSNLPVRYLMQATGNKLIFNKNFCAML